MGKNGYGKQAMMVVALRPEVRFFGEKKPTADELDRLHRQAHEECFMTNSVRTDARFEPMRHSG